MTHLERLISQHVESATVTTLSGATERIAEEMARELLADETFRAEMRQLIRENFTRTLRALNQPARTPKRKARP